jgi:hypothetical protein
MSIADPKRIRRAGVSVRRVVTAVAVFAASFAVLPRQICGIDASGWWSGEGRAVMPLARAVADSGSRGTTLAEFNTGSERFDAEWAYVTCTMTVLGLGQVIRNEGNHREDLLPGIHGCLDYLANAASREFGTTAWGEDGASVSDSENGHAYLGYWNLALGMHRLLEPDSEFSSLHDQLTETLARRLSGKPIWQFQTYPGEVYPADIAAVIGSLALHTRATGQVHPEVSVALESFRRFAVDSSTGLVYQALADRTGKPLDHPRGSGTALSVYFLSFADPALSLELHDAVRTRLNRSLLGFGAVREYPKAVKGGYGDIDSGPVLLGLSVSATGFAISGARLHGDRNMFIRLYRTAFLFGAPIRKANYERWLTGGRLGDAILLSMLTARGV